MTTTTTIPNTMRASVLHPDLSVTLEERPLPAVASDEVLVQVGAVGICGSDVHYWKEGRIGDFVVREPMILGHEAGGTVAAVGSDVDPERVGQRVGIEPQRPCRVCQHCKAGRYNLCPHMEFYATPPIDGAFCEYVTIQHDFAHPVPDQVSDEGAALLEPLSVGLTTMRKAGVVPGSRVLIAGAGPIGIIAAQTARAFGAAEVIVSDPVAERRDLALKFGATSVLDPVANNMAEANLDVDAFVDAAGVTPAVVGGIRNVRPAGRVVLVGMGADEIPLPIPVIQNRELIVTGIFRYTDTWPLGAHLVTSHQIDLDSLVTARFGIADAVSALDAATDPRNLKVVVFPGQ